MTWPICFSASIPALFLLTAAPVVAVPPPPLSPGTPDYVTEIRDAYDNDDFDRYASFFSADVYVTEDGKVAAHSPAKMQAMRHEWKSKNLSFGPIAWATGGRTDHGVRVRDERTASLRSQ